MSSLHGFDSFEVVKSLQSVIHLLHRAGQCGDALFAANVPRATLTARQATVLLTIAAADRNTPLRQADIVARTGIDRSTVADIVRRLVEQSILARERTLEDARAYAVTLTPHGRKFAKLLAAAIEASNAWLLEAVPAADRVQFVRSLQAIATTFGPISSAAVKTRD